MALAPWVLVPEEQLTHLTTIPGAPPKDLIRADMTFFETPNNGAVFSTGSITFCGCLPVNNFDNNISRLLQNVVERFLDPTRGKVKNYSESQSPANFHVELLDHLEFFESIKAEHQREVCPAAEVEEVAAPEHKAAHRFERNGGESVRRRSAPRGGHLE